MISETETHAIRAFLRSHPRRFASRVGEVEVTRAAARAGVDQSPVTAVFQSIDVIKLTGEVSRLAPTVQPLSLRSLDAIHLASALAIADELDAFITYDAKLGDAAHGLGLPFAVLG